MNSRVRERIASPFAMVSAAPGRNRRREAVIKFRCGESAKIPCAAAHIVVALVAAESEARRPAPVEGVFAGEKLFQLVKGCTHMRVFDAVHASFKPSMDNAENDRKIERFFAFNAVLRQAAAEEAARLIPETLEQLAQLDRFFTEMSSAVQADLGPGPLRASCKGRELNQHRVIMLRALFFPDIVARVSGEAGGVIEVAADQLL